MSVSSQFQLLTPGCCPQAADIQARVTELMRGALAHAADPKEPLQPGDLLRLAATVRVLEALAEVSTKCTVSVCVSD